MGETSGPESTNSCDHFSYFKPLGTRRLLSHQPRVLTQHHRPQARDGSPVGGCARPGWDFFFFFQKREFDFLSARLVPETVLMFSIHCHISSHLCI